MIKLNNHFQKSHKACEQQHKKPVSFKGGAYELKRYVVKNPKFPTIQTTAFIGNLSSGLAYLIAGPALIYEFAHDKFSKNKAPEQRQNSGQKNILTAGKSFFAVDSDKQKAVYKMFMDNEHFARFSRFSENLQDKHKKTGSEKEGLNTLTPDTKIGKTGIKAARFAVTTAGAAGFVNGIAMRLPVLAIGEGITALSAPIVETPVGLAIFGIGLGAINLARVLDTDPRFKIDPIKYKNSNLAQKTAYVAQNIGKTCAELMRSTKTVGKNAVKLFSKQSKEAVNFFKTHMLSTNPTRLILKEVVNKDGKVTVERAMKTSPYLMHFATVVLSLGAAGIILFNKLNQPKAEKASLRVHNAGNAVDNVALTKWGAEKFKSSSSPAYKTSGIFSAIAGVSILSSQPGLDKNWGRGLDWAGIGFILTGFAMERHADLKKLWKNRKIQTEATSLMRQWRVDLDKMFSPQELKKKVTVNGKEKTQLKAIIEGVNKGEKLPEKLETTLGKIEKVLNPNSRYRENLKPHRLEKGFPALKIEGDSGSLSEVTGHLQKQSVKMFGESPNPV